MTSRSPTTHQDLLELIRTSMPALTGSGRRVAETVLDDPAQMVGLSAAGLAKVSASSVGSVVRFCHHLGLPGYHDFQLLLAVSAGHDPLATIAAWPVARSVAEDVLRRSLADLARSVASIDVDDLSRAADRIRAAERVLVCSSGPSNPVATTFGSSLARVGRTVYYPTDVETQEAVAETLGPDDVCLAISHSGDTERTLRVLDKATVAGAQTIAITSFGRSSIAALCDVVVVAGAAADAHRTADTASRVVHHAIIQALGAQVLHPDLPTPTESRLGESIATLYSPKGPPMTHHDLSDSTAAEELA
jgi:DNA-binding MurR/RpiR family transcriptional regulator